jgi:metal-sulfur cluster biosynthetic enzyme
MPKRETTTHPLNADVLECLLEVMDPEIGLSVVDLGLVYQATQDGDGIRVALTLTTRACPLGEMILEDTRERLARRFKDSPSISVTLVWNPPWKPDLITDRGLELLGRLPRDAA